MADTKEVILNIKTNFSENIDALAKLQKEIDDLKVAELQLNAAVKSGTKTREEADKELEAIAAQVRNLKGQQREYRKEIDNEIKSHKENEGSIKQMRLQLIEMRKEYEALSKQDREGDKGKAMLENISRTTEELKDLEKAQGDFRREVGHYENALNNLDPKLAKALAGFRKLSGGTMDFGKAMKNAIPMVKAFGKQLGKLATNPYVLAIVAVITIIKKLIEQFRATDDAMTALQQLFAAFSPVIEVFTGLLDVLVKGLTKVIMAATKAVTALMALGNGFRSASEDAQQWVSAMDQLEETERQYTVKTAKNNVEIARARNKAAQADKYTIEERRDALADAIKLEKENLNMELEVAETKWRLAIQDAARRKDTTDETKNNIADLEAAYYNAIANTEAGMRRLYSQMAKFNEDIRKENINTWKSIIGNSAFSTADWKKADADYKKLADNMEKRAQELAARAADIAAAGMDNTALLDASKKAQKEAEDIRNEQKSEHKKYLDALKALSEAYYNNELNARRAYEDALLSMMDDSLEKQLKAVELEYTREIEDLRHKLKTEEHLSVEAREAIQKTIELKQEQWNRKRILTEAAYWSEVRKTAKEALDGISQMVADFVNSDPNRVVGAFAESVKQTFRGIDSGITAEYENITRGFQSDIQALIDTAARFTEYPSEGVAKVMKVLADRNSDFMKNATKSVTSFIDALAELRKEAGLSGSELSDVEKLLFPYLQNIQDYYKTMLTLPNAYISSTMNKVTSMMTQKAGEVKDSILKGLDFNGISQEAEMTITRLFKHIDTSLANRNNWTDIIGGTLVENEETATPYLFQIDWSKFKNQALTPEAKNALDEMGVKYGDEISSSLVKALGKIVGSDDVSVISDYIVRNYEEVVEKITQYNRDMAKALQMTGDQVFANAMIDESVAMPQLRKIYEYAMANDKMRVDWERERLEAEQRYVGEVDSELKVQLDLLEIEKRKAVIDKNNAQYQKDYLVMQRNNVAQLEDDYNRINTLNTGRIAALEGELLKLREAQASFDENTSGDEVSSNAAQIAMYEQAIERMRKEIADALKALADTGFMSTDELDKTIEQLTNSILRADNTILANTNATTKTVTQLWLNSFTRVTGGLGQIGSAFNSMFSEMGEMNERWNAFAEASAYFTIGVNMAEGIAEAVAAGSGLVWPANLAAIASGIAAVVAGIGSAFSVYNQYHKPSFAEGGLIGGRYAKSRAEGRRDDVPINASRGEYIINADSVRKYGVDFLDMLNYGKSVSVKPKIRFADGGYVSDYTAKSGNNQMQMDTMREMVAEVMSEIHPVVSVREITNVQNKVRAKESVARK